VNVRVFVVAVDVGGVAVAIRILERGVVIIPVETVAPSPAAAIIKAILNAYVTACARAILDLTLDAWCLFEATCHDQG